MAATAAAVKNDSTAPRTRARVMYVEAKPPIATIAKYTAAVTFWPRPFSAYEAAMPAAIDPNANSQVVWRESLVSVVVMVISLLGWQLHEQPVCQSNSANPHASSLPPLAALPRMA